MHKIGSEQVAAVAARGASTLRAVMQKNASLEQENFQLREKIASMERDREIEAIATEMEEKGLNEGMSLDEKIAHISKHNDLNRVREAVKMAGAGNIRIAEVADDPGHGSSDDLTLFCLGGE